MRETGRAKNMTARGDTETQPELEGQADGERGVLQWAGNTSFMSNW